LKRVRPLCEPRRANRLAGAHQVGHKTGGERSERGACPLLLAVEKLSKPLLAPLLTSFLAPEPLDARSALWTEGLGRLRRLTGKPDTAARGLLGKLCREARDDCALVASLLHEAEAQRVGDPIPWLSAAIQSRTGQRPSSRPRESNLAWMHGMLATPQAPAFDLDLTATEIAP
jgi:hypothetical protein